MLDFITTNWLSVAIGAIVVVLTTVLMLPDKSQRSINKQERTFSVLIAHIGGWMVVIGIVVFLVGGIITGIYNSIVSEQAVAVKSNQDAVVQDVMYAMRQEANTIDCSIPKEGKILTQWIPSESYFVVQLKRWCCKRLLQG